MVPVGARIWCRVRIEGLENVPETGPLILASNHIDNFDAGAIGYRLKRHLHFMGRPEIFRTTLRGMFWRRMSVIPADGEGLAQGIAILRAGGALGIFPEGVISPALVPARAGTGILAMRAKAPIVPVAISGTDRIRGWRSAFRPVRVTIRYGEAIDAASWPAGTGKAQELTDLVMRRIAAMLPEVYRGAYASDVERGREERQAV